MSLRVTRSSSVPSTNLCVSAPKSSANGPSYRLNAPTSPPACRRGAAPLRPRFPEQFHRSQRNNRVLVPQLCVQRASLLLATDPSTSAWEAPQRCCSRPLHAAEILSRPTGVFNISPTSMAKAPTVVRAGVDGHSGGPVRTSSGMSTSPPSMGAMERRARIVRGIHTEFRYVRPLPKVFSEQPVACRAKLRVHELQ